MNRMRNLGALGLVLALGVMVGCGDDDRPPARDSGPGTDGGMVDGFVPPPPDGGGRDGGGTDGSIDLCDGVDCTSLDDACNAGACNAATGTCEAQPRADGTSCDDGDACTTGDACTAGACGGSAMDCSGMTDMCNTGVCDPGTGACVADPATDGTACDDGDLCTTADMCTAGVCGATAVDCSAMTDMCNTGVCDATSGACVAMPVTDGTACDDASLCTTGDVCTTGACAGAAVDCSGSSDMCNTGVCDATSGACVAMPVTDGTACDDASACTMTDVCTTGVCGGTPTAVTGDTCAGPMVITPTDGLQTINGMLSSCAMRDYATSGCGAGGPGRELVYSLTLTEGRWARFETVAPASGGYDTVLHIRSTCGAVASEVACDDDGGTGTYSRITTWLNPGTYFVMVDEYLATSTTAGNYSLQVELTEPASCATAAPIATPARGATTTVRGSTAGDGNNFTSTCGASAASPDNVFRLVITAATAGDYRFETVTGTTFDSVLHLRGSPCAEGAGTTLACDDDGGGPVNLSRIVRAMTAGTYYLVVDGYSSSNSGNYVLEVERLAPGHAVLIGHDYYASNTNVDRLVGNAVFLANTTGAVSVLEYTQYSDNTAGGEAANARAAINARATALGRTVTFTALTDYTMLASSLAGRHVLVVYEQENAPGGMMTTVATAWNATLNTFLDNGGVVVVMDYSGESWRILNGAGLMTIASATGIGTGVNVNVVAAGDAVATGVATPYLATNGSNAYPGSSGGTVVTSNATGAVVRHLVR